MGKRTGPFSDDKKAELKAATRGAALALVDDLGYLRRQLENLSPSPGDVRRLSAIARRLLVESDLVKVAGPRVGRIEILGPDSRKLERLHNDRPFVFLAVGLHYTFGSEFWAIALEHFLPWEKAQYRGDNAISRELVSLKFDTFMQQRVVYFKGGSATRAEAIKYVANVAHGVHSGTAKDDAYRLLEQVRYIGTFDTTIDDKRSFHVNYSFLLNQPTEEVPHVVDLPLMVLWNALHFVVNSPDVLRLEEHIDLHG